MIPKELSELIEQLEPRLKNISLLHDEIGTVSSKREEDLNQLCQAVITLADSHIHTMIDERDSLQLQCQQTYKHIVRLKRLMGEYVDENLQDHKPPYAITLDKLTISKEITQKHYEKRLADVQELYHRLHDYKATLGSFVNTELIMHDNVDVSIPVVTALEEEIIRCDHEYVKRAQQVDSGTQQIVHLWEILGVSPQSTLDDMLSQLYKYQRDPEKSNPLYVELVQEHQLDKILQTIAQLDEMKQQREFRKQEITQHLHRLWDRLQVNVAERDHFLQSNQGVTLIEVQQYELELDRMLKLKSEKVQDFILDARNEMEKLWNQLYFSQLERDAFDDFYSDDYNDTLLEKHENEIERLKHMVEDRKYILDKVERHMKLQQEVQDFEASTNDPKRLFGKGQRDPGRLLREEKFRKRISRELPKSKRELEGALREFETSTGTPFTVYGERYMDKLIANEKTTSTGNDQLPTTPRRPTTVAPMTSPRYRSHAKMQFRTPQPNRSSHFHESFSETKNEWRRLDSQVSSATTILHRVRQNNIRKREKSRLPKLGSASKPLCTYKLEEMNNDINIKRRRPSDETASSAGSSQGTLVEKDYRKNENVAPSTHAPVLKQKRRIARTLSERRALLFEDDEVSLDLGIFDDGPELSDMSENGD